jgi:hypothetical protein
MAMKGRVGRLHEVAGLLLHEIASSMEGYMEGKIVQRPFLDQLFLAKS